MLKRPILAAVMCVCVLFLCAQAPADLMISYTTNGSVYNEEATIGETVPVPVYVLQIGDTSGDRALLGSDGLFSAGVQVDYTATSGGRADIASMTIATHWDDTTFAQKGFDNSRGTSAMVGSRLNTESLVVGNPILIGTINFLCDEVGVTEISSGDVVWSDPALFPGTFGNVIYSFKDNDLVPLDPAVFGSDNSRHTLGTITTVPEPSAIVLTAMGFAAICTFGIFRKRKCQS